MTTAALYDPAAPLTATGTLRRRRVVNRLAEAVATLAALAAVALLGIVVAGVIARGASVINLGFLTKQPPLFGGPGGGIAPAIVGTAVIVAVATAIAMPIGVLVALHVTEFARPRTARVIRLGLDLTNGLPSIVVGLFVFGLLVAGHEQSGVAASIALAIIMLPLIARSSEEMLLLVPPPLREAADALGVRRWRTVLGVVLPHALGGIVTGTVLAVARAAGETAPLVLLTSIFPNGVHWNPFGHALSTIPFSIFSLSEQADPAGYERAWGSALVLLSFILVANVGARALLARNNRSRTTR